MNKRYMDFVPVNRAKKLVKKIEEVGVIDDSINVPAEPEVPRTASSEPVTEDVSIEEFFAVNENPRRVTTAVEYGIIEEYRPKFVKTEIKKRPLGQPDGKFAKKADIKELKARKIVGKKAEGVSKASANSGATGVSNTAEKKAVSDKKSEATLKVPAAKTRFVNTDKIEKRPLSKTIYKKKVVAPKEEPKGPVTIIEKPEEGSRVGIVITIIITIILGAAAGTVAFLLLPK